MLSNADPAMLLGVFTMFIVCAALAISEIDKFTKGK